jgi:hypothetical protein
MRAVLPAAAGLQEERIAPKTARARADSIKDSQETSA